MSIARRKAITSSVLLTVLALGVMAPRVRASTLRGNLKHGPYAVGFKTILTYDLSRPALTRDVGGKEITSAPRGRQMQIGVWYPASKAVTSSFMRFEDYVYLSSQELDFAPLNAKRRDESIRAFMKEPLSAGASAESLQALMRMRTRAIKDALAAHGQFPLVVYAHVPPSSNSIMCEYLASHGFVVASVSGKGTFEYTLEVSLTGIETQVKDIEFAVGLLRATRNVDADKIALIGMSFGAISVLGVQTRNAEIDAVISLDGGIGSSWGSNAVQRTPYHNLSRINVPLLHMHAPIVPAMGADLTYINTLKYSDRYLVEFPGMRHADFVNHGMLKHFFAGIQGKPLGDTKEGFEWVCRYALHFLKAFLKGNGDSLSALQNPPHVNGVPKGLLTLKRKRKLAAPPSARQLQAMIEEGGVQRVTALYTRLKNMDAQPVPQQTLSEVGRWLGEKGDWTSAREIVELRLDSYPKSTWAHYAAAEVYRRLGNDERARQLYDAALRLLPGDFDPELDTRRQGIYEGARRYLDLTNRM